MRPEDVTPRYSAKFRNSQSLFTGAVGKRSPFGVLPIRPRTFCFPTRNTALLETDNVRCGHDNGRLNSVGNLSARSLLQQLRPSHKPLPPAPS